MPPAIYCETKIGCIAQSRCIRAVNRGPGSRRQNRCLKMILHRPDPLFLFGQFFAGAFRGFAQADDGGNILRPRAPPALVRSADERRLKASSGFDIEGAHAFWTVKLVR